MAQLKDTVVAGSLRITDELLTNSAQFKTLKIPTSSGGNTYGVGTNLQVLRSDGTNVYWGSAVVPGATASVVNTPSHNPVVSFVSTQSSTDQIHTISYAKYVVNSATAAAGSWSSATPPTQDVQVANVNSDQLIQVSLADTATDAEIQAAANARIRATVTTQHYVTLTAYGGAPEINIPITVVNWG